MGKNPTYSSWSTQIIRDVGQMFGMETKSLNKNELIEKLTNKKANRVKGPRTEVKTKNEFKYNLFKLSGENNATSTKLLNDKFKKIVDPFKNESWFDDDMRRILQSSTTHFKKIGNFFTHVKVTPKWLHIDEIQSDLWGDFARLKVNEKLKTAIKGLEMDYFKTAMSYLVKKNSSIQFFTLNYY